MKTVITDGAAPVSNLLLVTADAPLSLAVLGVIQGIPYCHVSVCADVRQAFEFCFASEIHVVALHLPDHSSLESVVYFSQQVQKRGIRVVVISDSHRPQDELELTRLENVTYLERPLDLRRFAFLLQQATARVQILAKQGSARDESSDAKIPCLLDRCPETRRLMEQVQRVASQDATMLLLGETGTGKTRLARMIHEMSPRAREPFIVINCGSCAASLMNSELFGHVKGAFTGADVNRDGKLLAAGRGTVLLDDIEALPLESQAKLLRVLEQNGEFEPVGSNKTLKLQARVIVASNQPLTVLAQQGRFRKDLYFRLNVVEFRLPPLRDCGLAIEPLARRFASEYSGTRNPVTVTQEAICALEAYDWPGNVRELQHAMQRAVMLCRNGTITCDDLPDPVRESVEQQIPFVADESFVTVCPNETQAATRSSSEPTLLALRECGGNKAAAARKLGISREALYKRIRKISPR